MAPPAARKPKRERPVDGGMPWHARLNAFECLGCGEFYEVHSRRKRDDHEHMNVLREALIDDHAECWQFDDPQLARDARKYRKSKTLRENQRRRLNAQVVSWRGR